MEDGPMKKSLLLAQNGEWIADGETETYPPPYTLRPMRNDEECGGLVDRLSAFSLLGTE